MSCCGNHRAAQRASSAAYSEPSSAYWSGGATIFAYSGSGQLTVTGPLTGTVYRFTPGAAVLVHASDAPSVATVPGLKPVA